MRTLNKMFFVLYFLVLIFYGLLIKFLYGTQYLKYLKLLPEIILALFLITCYSIAKEKRGFQLIDSCLLVVVSTICAISIFRDSSFSSVAVFIRDFLIPICCLILLRGLKFDKRMLHFYYHALAIISIIFILSNLYFGYMQYSNSYEYTAQWYTKKVFYGYDEMSSLSLTSTNGRVRAMGLVGNSAKYGFYSVFAFVFISLYYKRLSYFVLSFGFSLLNVLFSTNKSSLVCILLLAMVEILFIYYKGNHRMVFGIFMFVFAGIAAGVYLSFNMDKLSSIGDRFELWSKYDYINMENIIIGTNIFSYFGSENGWMSVIDSVYLFGCSSFGVVVFIFFIVYIAKQSNKTRYLQIISIMFFVLGLTTNLFSGRCFFNIYCIIAGIEASKISFRHKNNQQYYELFSSRVNRPMLQS